MKPTTPVYIIKPKYIFKTPFLKYDLQNPTNREAQNEELTEYFNYGFNEDTMNIYVKLVNRMLKVLDHKKNLQYFDEPSQLMRLNDEIPMDLGGFGKFYDPEIFKNDFIQNDQQLFKIFLFNIVSASCFTGGKQYPTYPMLEFVKSMYPPKQTDQNPQLKQDNPQPNPLTEMVSQITKNLQKKYEETMKKLIEQKNMPKQVNPTTPPFKKNPKFDKKPYNDAKSQDKNKRQDKQHKKQTHKKKDKRSRNSSSSSDSSSSSSSSDSSSSDSDDSRGKKHRDRKERDSRKATRKERRSKSKSKGKRQRTESRKQSRKESRKDSRKQSRKESRKESRHDSHREPRHERRDSRNQDRHKERKRSEHKRSRSRDHKSHRR